jgi:hypothetical protein
VAPSTKNQPVCFLTFQSPVFTVHISSTELVEEVSLWSIILNGLIASKYSVAGDDNLPSLVKKLIQNYSKTASTTKLSGIPYDAKFIFSSIGYNFLPLEISSAFALAQLKRLPDFLALRLKHYNRLYEFFSNHQDLFILPEQTPNTTTAWLAFPLDYQTKSAIHTT